MLIKWMDGWVEGGMDGRCPLSLLRLGAWMQVAQVARANCSHLSHRRCHNPPLGIYNQETSGGDAGSRKSLRDSLSVRVTGEAHFVEPACISLSQGAAS